MDTLVGLAVIAGIVWLIASSGAPRRPPGRPPIPRPRRHRDNAAGASAARRASQLARDARGGPGRRLLAAAGITTRSAARDQRTAAQWQSGAVGEQLTATILASIPGIHVLHDRALPRGKANVDHLVVTGCGRLLLVDSKLWSGRYRISITRDGRLLHGTHDRTKSLNSARYEAEQVSAALGGVPVGIIIAVHRAPIADGAITTADGIRIIPAAALPDTIRALSGRARPSAARRLAEQADRALPPHRHN
ncbi:nuclease-related domain-containing protein [Streptomyces harbinensis]|uniref:nuclease-related domain-containing protein n=1 Tax=Streptomyces harbinensis TaxID=1176198 RepID=UPI00372374AE